MVTALLKVLTVNRVPPLVWMTSTSLASSLEILWDWSSVRSNHGLAGSSANWLQIIDLNTYSNSSYLKLAHLKFLSQSKDIYMLSGEWDRFPPISLLFFQNGQSDGLQGCDQWHEFYQYRHQGLWSTNQFLRLLRYASLFERRCLQQCKSYPK